MNFCKFIILLYLFFYSYSAYSNPGDTYNCINKGVTAIIGEEIVQGEKDNFIFKWNDDNSFTFSGIIFAPSPYKLKAIQSGELFIAESTQGIFAYNKGDIYLSEVAKGQVASLHAKCKIF